MDSARHFADLARDFSSSRPSRSAGVLARWLSALTSPFGAKLMPSPILTGASASTGNEAMTFMSGSTTTPGITMVGSSPGCQRSMLPGEPSDEPKNSVEVFTEKPSRGAASSAAGTSPERFGTPVGFVSSDNARSYSFSRGALSASRSSGSSGACSVFGGNAEVFAPFTDELEVAGSSGFASAGGAASAGVG